MTTLADTPRYFFHVGRQRVDAVLRLPDGPDGRAGKRVFRSLCSFEAAHLDPQAKPLPTWSDAERDAFLLPLWRAARDALAGEGARRQAARTIGDLWQSFIKASAADKAPGTIVHYTRTRAAYLAVNGNHAMAAFSLHHVDALKVHGRSAARPRKLSPHTINHGLACLRAFLRWAHERDELDKLPRFKNVPAPRRQPMVLRPDEVQALLRRLARLANTGPSHRRLNYRRHLRFFLVGVGCGLRRGEILNLRWREVDLDQGTLSVRITTHFRTKEHREKTIPLPPFLWRFLEHERPAKDSPERWLLDDGTGQRAFQSKTGAKGLSMAFHRHLVAIGAARKGLKPAHGLRALFATTLHRGGTDAYTIQQLMGHSSIAITEHYLADPGAAKRRAVSTLALPRVARPVAGILTGTPSG